jgi:alpha,alpha-trehalase
MIKRYSIVIFYFLMISCTTPRPEATLPVTRYVPDEDLGELFTDVQLNRIFKDSKTFVDCSPNSDPAAILQAYRSQKNEQGFDLKEFVDRHFSLPDEPALPEMHPTVGGMVPYLQNHWNYLTRMPDTLTTISSLIPLPNPYIVPGGRFREIYYWDSYFTMVGLAGSNWDGMVRNMLDNFAYLIDEVGFIPNGNRTYYLSRSQPPFFSSMVMLYAQKTGGQAALGYLPQLEKEYAYWMAGAENLTDEQPARNRVVLVAPGVVLNRYWDDKDTPRPESYYEDVELASHLPEALRPVLYRELRAAAASGWDFSSRWMADKDHLSSLITTQILPVDLNCLIYHMESTLAELHTLQGNTDRARHFAAKAEARKQAITSYFWNQEKGFFYDYNYIANAQTDALTMAGAFPLYYGLANAGQATSTARILENDFLKGGGFVTTLQPTGEQWDFPNGWAPLQWIAVQGLRQYEQHQLAKTATDRWLLLNERVLSTTDKMMEKYNVVDLSLEAGGGEYPLQDGFGWTNGVAIGLAQLPD